MHHEVLALDQGGRPSHWMTWEEAVVLKVKGLVAWHIGDEFDIHGGTSRLTGRQTVVTVPSVIAIKGQRVVSRVALTNPRLFKRDHHVCCYCGQQFPRGQLSREHILPVSRGGPDTWLNCATACANCNNRKGARLPAEANMPLLYLPYEPNVAEALILSGRHIVADQMEFLVACLPKHSRAMA